MATEPTAATNNAIPMKPKTTFEPTFIRNTPPFTEQLSTSHKQTPSIESTGRDIGKPKKINEKEIFIRARLPQNMVGESLKCLRAYQGSILA
jgi:hypothetical protein